MRKSALFWALLLALPSSEAVGQQGAAERSITLDPGTRVRLAMRLKTLVPGRERIAGTIRLTTGDTIVLDTTDVWKEQRTFFPSPVLVEEARQVRLPVEALGRVEVSRGRSRALGVLRGAVGGVVFGGALLGLSEMSGRVNPGMKDFTRGAIAGAATGLAIGIPVGYFMGVERWRPVPLRGLWPRGGQLVAQP